MWSLFPSSRGAITFLGHFVHLHLQKSHNWPIKTSPLWAEFVPSRWGRYSASPRNFNTGGSRVILMTFSPNFFRVIKMSDGRKQNWSLSCPFGNMKEWTRVLWSISCIQIVEPRLWKCLNHFMIHEFSLIWQSNAAALHQEGLLKAQLVNWR